MDLNPPFKTAKRRVHRKRSGAPGGAPVVALAVVSVQDIDYDNDALTLTAVFNTTNESPLNGVGGAVAGKWIARYDGKRFVGQGLALIAFDQVRVAMSEDEPEAGVDELNYTNAPSDISDVLGRQLAAFAGFAI